MSTSLSSALLRMKESFYKKISLEVHFLLIHSIRMQQLFIACQFQTVYNMGEASVQRQESHVEKRPMKILLRWDG